METIRYNSFKNYFQRVELLKSNKSDFIIEKTSSTNIIKILGEKGQIVSQLMFSSEYTPMHLLPLMGKIKKEITEREEVVLKANLSHNPFDCNYYEFKQSLYEMKMEAGAYYEFNNVWEADITGAYYKTALLLNFISQEMYDKCMGLEKIHRLKVLGSIATSKTIYRYEKGKIANIPLIMESELHRKAWFKICSYVNNAMQCMRDCFRENFLFYWVDGIYFTNLYKSDFDFEDEEVIAEQFNKMAGAFNFDWKIIKLDKIEVVNTGDHIQLKVHKNGEIKPFSLPRKKVIYYGMGTEQEFMNIN